MRSNGGTRSRRLLAAVACCAAAFSLTGLATGTASAAEGEILAANRPTSVPGAYIVKVRDDVRAGVAGTADRLAGRVGGQVTHRYDALGAFAARMSEAQAKRLAADPAVEFVEQDQVFHAVDSQPNATWGLDRVDQKSLPLDSTYNYPSSAGAGVTAYIIDSGINANHREFTGRVKQGRDFIDQDNTPNDCNAHGTHVAGTVAGSTYGVAKKASIVAVKVLKCDGYTQGNSWLDGMNWVAANAVRPAVANMSIGGGASSSVDTAIRKMVGAGVTVVVAAGNSGVDACGTSSREPSAIVAAASDRNDRRSQFGSGSSNWGKCVDLFGPGSNVVSADYANTTGTRTMSGTSMASPHVAGAAALYLGTSGNSGKSPAEVSSALTGNATPDKITDPRTGTPNKLLYTGFLGR